MSKDIIIPETYKKASFISKKTKNPNFTKDKIIKITSFKEKEDLVYQVIDIQEKSKFSFIELIFSNYHIYKKSCLIIIEKIEDNYHIFIGNKDRIYDETPLSATSKIIKKASIINKEELLKKVDFLISYYSMDFSLYSNDEDITLYLNDLYKVKILTKKEYEKLFEGIKPIEEFEYRVINNIKLSILPFFLILIFFIASRIFLNIQNNELIEVNKNIVLKQKKIKDGSNSSSLQGKSINSLEQEAKEIQKTLELLKNKEFCYDN